MRYPIKLTVPIDYQMRLDLIKASHEQYSNVSEFVRKTLIEKINEIKKKEDKK